MYFALHLVLSYIKWGQEAPRLPLVHYTMCIAHWMKWFPDKPWQVKNRWILLVYAHCLPPDAHINIVQALYNAQLSLLKGYHFILHTPNALWHAIHHVHCHKLGQKLSL